MKSFVVILCMLFCYALADDPTPPVAPPGNLSVAEAPQFVMLTFDDAVNIINYNRTYQKLFKINNKKNGCPIAATYFVSHEYNNYILVNDLYRRGHEIASHSITHKSGNGYWKSTNKQQWIDEIGGMKKLLVKHADIPEKAIRGFRSPFLQTAGNITFRILKDLNFLYDCSMPTLVYSNPEGKKDATGPAWPYKLDRGFRQDCQIEPCPNESFDNLWIVPMNDYWKMRVINDETKEEKLSPCAMVDFCLPQPETAEDTKKYLMQNFKRHYETNRAPFPVFLHESWLIDDNRRKGFFEFLKDITQKDDVFVVTIQEVLKWMENPVPLNNYIPPCFRDAKKTNCQNISKDLVGTPTGSVCNYYNLKEFWGSSRSFTVCGKPRTNSTCPTTYPWVNTGTSS